MAIDLNPKARIPANRSRAYNPGKTVGHDLRPCSAYRQRGVGDRRRSRRIGREQSYSRIVPQAAPAVNDPALRAGLFQLAKTADHDFHITAPLENKQLRVCAAAP